jgi:GT2 family glycosyltransferase
VKKIRENDYYQYLSSIRNPKAVTAAALMIQKTLFNEIGGFDSKKLKVAFNDVDLCLKLLEAGYFNVWLPHVELVHHESKSRKQSTSPHLHKVARENFEFKVINKRYNLNNYYHTQYD